MKIGIFLKSANHPYYEKALRNFAEGIKTTNDNVFLCDKTTYKECDVAIFWGSWKDRSAIHHVVKNKIILEQNKRKKKFIVLETPIIGREICDSHSYLRIGINHFLWDVGEFNNKNSSSNRWEKMKKILDIEVSPWREEGDHILVALQLPGDASLRKANISKWASDVIIELRKYTNRKIIIRPHPVKRKYDMNLLNRAIEISKNAEMIDPETYTLSQNLQNCWCSVTYTSGMAIDSVIAGIPTISCNSGNMTWPIMSHSLSEIENPKTPDRTQWFSDMAYVQWSLDEIKQGLPWQHLKEVL